MVEDSARRAVLEQATSRRAVLRAGGVAVVGGPAALLSACSTKAPPRPPAPTPGVRPTALQADVVLLNAALDVEHTAIAAYTAGIPLLVGGPRAAAKQFLKQELSHASELSTLVHEGGGKPNQPSPTYAFGNPRRGEDVLTLLHAIERETIRFYLDIVPRLGRTIVRSIVASILANEAQHVSVLLESVGRPPAPSAFVTAAE